jgi:6-phosphofructokinase
MKGIAKEAIIKLRRRFAGTGRTHGMILMAETAIPLDALPHLDDSDVGLSENEKTAVRTFLKSEYWDRPQPALDEIAVKEIKHYLGCREANVVLSQRQRKAIQEYHHSLRTTGQTPDDLRTAALKLVSKVLQREVNTIRGDPYWQSFRSFTSEPRHVMRAVAPRSSDILFAQRLGTLAVDGAMAGFHDFMISQWLTEYVMVPLRLVVLGRKRVPTHGIFYKSAIAKTGQPADLL